MKIWKFIQYISFISTAMLLINCGGGGGSQGSNSSDINNSNTPKNNTNTPNSEINGIPHIPNIPNNSKKFPSAYYPIKAHPRLWLTNERLDSIRYEKNQGTTRWQSFKEMCDSIVDSDKSNDPYGLDTSPQNFTAPLALMYKITNNSIYADKALELMDKTDTDLSKYGDPDHQSFYFLGLTYDWLYNYEKMTKSKKEAYRKKMITLSNNFYNSLNLSASGTDSDQNLLTGNLHLTFGVAIYDNNRTFISDNINAITMLNRAWSGWTHGYYLTKGISNRDIVYAGVGGVYFTGMAYFPSTDIIGISGYIHTLKTACNYDINILESKLAPFWANTIESIIRLTNPTRTFIEDYGSWQDPNTLSTQPWLRRAMTIASYFALQNRDKEASALALGYNKYVDIGYYNDPFLELFYNLPKSTAHSPYNKKYELPYIHFAKNPDFLLYRDSWKKDAIWGVFRGDGSIPLDQQAPDHGSFSLWYKEGYLTKGARNYEALSHGDFFNTLSIQNNCTNNGVSCSGTAIFDSQKSATISRHKIENSSPLFAYAMLEADGQWNDSNDVYKPVQNVKTYRRHFFWTPKYVILFDRLHTKTPLSVRYRLRAMSEPTITGDTISQTTTAGNYKLLHKTLEPSNVTINKINEKILWQDVDDWIVNSSQRKWQSYIDFNNTTALNLLNVMQMGDSSMSSFDTMEHIDDSYNSGVKIGQWVVVFNKKEELRDSVTYKVSYSLVSTKTYHFIGDMKEGVYKIKINGTMIKDSYSVSKNDNSIFFETTNTISGTNRIEIIKG